MLNKLHQHFGFNDIVHPWEAQHIRGKKLKCVSVICLSSCPFVMDSFFQHSHIPYLLILCISCYKLLSETN